MDALHLLRRMAENNAWSNLRLHRACDELTEDEYRAKGTSFFPSLRLTLEHIYLVDVYYLDALQRGGHGRAMYAAPNPTFERFAGLAEAQRTVDAGLVAFVAALPETSTLDEVIAIERPDHDQRESIGDTLQHLFAHQIHHRGQAHAMLSGTRARPPQLDEFFMSEELPLREAELRTLGLPVR